MILNGVTKSGKQHNHQGGYGEQKVNKEGIDQIDEAEMVLVQGYDLLVQNFVLEDETNKSTSLLGECREEYAYRSIGE